MKKNKRGLLCLIGLMVFGVMYLSACQNNVNATLEESIAPYMELQAVEGASNATMVVNRGETKSLDSYFALDFSNIQPSGIFSEGTVEGWCLQWNKPLRQNNDVHRGMEVYSTFGNSSWKPANYLMNIKEDLKSEYPDITYREIQVALWSLIETPKFDLDEVLNTNRMPQRMISNGEPNFNVETVKQIVNKVQAEASEFEYKLGTPVLAYSHHGEEDDQQDVGTFLSGTAWGISDDSGLVYNFCGENWTNLNGVTEKMPNNWGWSNGTYKSGDSETLNLYVGANHCNTTNGDFLGTFEFTYENGEIHYTLDLTTDNDMKDLHVYVGNEVLPRQGGGKLTHSPGNLGYKSSINGGINSFSGTISHVTGDVYLAVHVAP